MTKPAKSAAPKQPARSAQVKRKPAAPVAKVAINPLWGPLARKYAALGMAPEWRGGGDIGIVGAPAGGRRKAKP
jgi:hypothetical protein